MGKYFNDFTVWISGIVGISIGLMGGYDPLLRGLLLFICLDYITGVIKAALAKKLTSQIGFKGIAKKVLILVLVMLAVGLQSSIGIDVPIREIVITFFLSNEALSIIENAAAIGLPMPKKLIDILLQLRGEENADNKEVN